MPLKRIPGRYRDLFCPRCMDPEEPVVSVQEPGEAHRQRIYGCPKCGGSFDVKGHQI